VGPHEANWLECVLSVSNGLWGLKGLSENFTLNLFIKSMKSIFIVNFEPLTGVFDCQLFLQLIKLVGYYFYVFQSLEGLIPRSLLRHESGICFF
jgi:hypothetical protein